uniref:Transcription factor BTF3 n=1 Tax=Macrostomum lignano TaxID=282301 RepID=A0A1I8FKJ5_9PLAT
QDREAEGAGGLCPYRRQGLRPAARRRFCTQNTGTDERKVTATLKKLGVNSIPGIEEVNMFKDNNEVIHFNNPKVQASLQANTFRHHWPTKRLTELLPTVWNQMGPDNFANLKRLATGAGGLARGRRRWRRCRQRWDGGLGALPPLPTTTTSRSWSATSTRRQPRPNEIRGKIVVTARALL